jgi:heptosyltransferase III
MGLETEEVYPRIILSSAEIAAGSEMLRSSAFGGPAPSLGVFVGGRSRHGKRWPADNFVRLIRNLTVRGVRVAVFVGPEERDLMGYFKDHTAPNTPVIFEPSLRKFAAMVSRCRLFLTCDSGPMHLACALGVRTVAIFQNGDFHRWGPPPALARIVHDPQGVSLESVESACLDEWAALNPSRRNDSPDQSEPSNATSNQAL